MNHVDQPGEIVWTFHCLYIWEPAIVFNSVDFNWILLLLYMFEVMEMIKAMFLFECNYLSLK